MLSGTEGSPYWIHSNFLKFEELTIPLAIMVDLVPLGTRSGPGAPDLDLARFHIRATPMEHRWNTPKSLKFIGFYLHFEIGHRWDTPK